MAFHILKQEEEEEEQAERWQQFRTGAACDGKSAHYTYTHVRSFYIVLLDRYVMWAISRPG